MSYGELICTSYLYLICLSAVARGGRPAPPFRVRAGLPAGGARFYITFFLPCAVRPCPWPAERGSKKWPDARPADRPGAASTQTHGTGRDRCERVSCGCVCVMQLRTVTPVALHHADAAAAHIGVYVCDARLYAMCIYHVLFRGDA